MATLDSLLTACATPKETLAQCTQKHIGIDTGLAEDLEWLGSSRMLDSLSLYPEVELPTL